MNTIKINIDKDMLHKLALGHCFSFTKGETEFTLTLKYKCFEDFRKAICDAEHTLTKK